MHTHNCSRSEKPDLTYIWCSVPHCYVWINLTSRYMVSVTDGPCLRLVIFLKKQHAKTSFFFLRILIRIKMTLIWAFKLFQFIFLNFFHSPTKFFLNRQTRYICRRTIFLVVVLMSVHFHSIHITYLKPGQNPAALVCELLENVICGLLSWMTVPERVVSQVLHDIHLFSINFTWSSLVIVKSQFGVLFVTLIDVPEGICFHRTALGLKHHNFHWL